MKCEQIVTTFKDKVAANKQYSSDLYTPIGDGDHGANMARGTSEIMILEVPK